MGIMQNAQNAPGGALSAALFTLLVLLALSVAPTAGSGAARPNVIFVILDDLDVLLGSEIMIPQTQRLIRDAGAHCTNYFVAAPKCTPSRAIYLSGRYYHNLRPGHAMQGRGLNTTSFSNPAALFPMFKASGYQTALFGKMHNDQGRWLCRPDNATFPFARIFSHIETLCSPCGHYTPVEPDAWVRLNPATQQTEFETLQPDDPRSGYAEAQYGNRSLRFIQDTVAAGQPFFLQIGTVGPHLPVIPAPWHREITANLSNTAPRTPNFNVHGLGKHPLVANMPALSARAEAVIDMHYRDRLGTLLSIDDMVAGLVQGLEQVCVLNNTFLVFTSDHGYHLGQARIPDEKMMPYETDLRVPFYIRGPGIAAGTVVEALVGSVDLAPTLLDLAGIAPPPVMDGRSMKPLLEGGDAASASWRTTYISAFAEGATQVWDTNAIWRITRGGVPGAARAAAFMPGLNVVGTDSPHPCPAVNYTDPHQCQAACLATDWCRAWVLHFNDGGPNPGWRCCAKTSIDAIANASAAQRITSGVRPSLLPLPDTGDGSINPPATPPNSTQKYIYDDITNQWRLLRILNATHDWTYVEFDQEYVFAPPTFFELYDNRADPWQMHNVWPTTPPGVQAALQAELAAYASCEGAACP